MQVLDGVVDQWLQETLEAPAEGVRRVLRRAYRDDEGEAGPRAALRKAVRALAEWRDFDAPWRRDPVDRRALITAALDAIHAFAALSAKGTPNDNLFIDTAPIRRFSRLHAARIPAGPAGEEALDAVEALLGPLARDKARHAVPERVRHDVRDRAATRGREGGSCRPEGSAAGDDGLARGRSRGVPPAGTAAVSRTLRGSQAGARRARLHRSADARPRPAASRPRRPRRLPAALPAAVRGRVPGHRSDPGRDPAAARGRRSRRGRLDPRAPRPRKAVHRRRPQAGDLPVPARRRRDVLAGQASARGRGRRGLRAAHVLPQRAGPPARDQPRVLAGDGRQRATRRRPTTWRSSRSRSDLATQPAARRAAGAQALQVEVRELRGHRGSLPDAIGRVRRVAGAEAAAGPCRSAPPGGGERARADRGPAHRDPVPAVHELGRRRHASVRGGARGATACRTCSSADAASTPARRWRRCAWRSAPSSGPTTSCRCTRRCAARSSRSRTISCSRIATRTAGGSIPRAPIGASGRGDHPRR